MVCLGEYAFWRNDRSYQHVIPGNFKTEIKIAYLSYWHEIIQMFKNTLCSFPISY